MFERLTANVQHVAEGASTQSVNDTAALDDRIIEMVPVHQRRWKPRSVAPEPEILSMHNELQDLK